MIGAMDITFLLNDDYTIMVIMMMTPVTMMVVITIMIVPRTTAATMGETMTILKKSPKQATKSKTCLCLSKVFLEMTIKLL